MKRAIPLDNKRCDSKCQWECEGCPFKKERYAGLGQPGSFHLISPFKKRG